MNIKQYQDFTGGLNLTQSSSIKDGEFVIAKNMVYNNERQIATRRGYKKFGNNFSSKPVTSYFCWQKDDTLEYIAICFSGGVMYKYNESTDERDSTKTGLFEFETLPGETTKRTRRDFAVYKNIVYMCDGVNIYARFDGTTYTSLGVGSAITGATADNTTDTFTKATHGLTDGNEIYFANGTLPTGITSGQVYYVISAATNTFKISTTKNGTAVNITSNGSGFEIFKLSQPRCRYISYLYDTIFAAGDDANPITLYHTNTAPTDGSNLTSNVVVIGGDETGRINGLSEYAKLVIVFKDNKSYGYLAGETNDPIDSQTGGYSDRSINVVGNSLVYFNERGVDTLQKRTGVDGVSAIESKPLSENVRLLIEKIKPKNYRSCASWYVKETNNYYFSFDTTGDDVPDTTLVYNSLVGSRTQVTFPQIYDYGRYVDSDGENKYIFASGSGGQCFEFETGFDDVGAPIETELQTKPRDNNDPTQVKEYRFVDITGYRENNNDPLTIKIIVDGNKTREVEVTSDLIDPDSGITISTKPISIYSIGGGEITNEELKLYKFTARIPMFVRGTNISVNMSGSLQRALDKIKLGFDNSVINIFKSSNIL